MSWDVAYIVVDTGCVQREDLWDENLDRVVDKAEVADEMARRAMTVRRFLGEEKRWTKDAEARDEDGDAVQYDSCSAKQWCLTGAMDKVQEKGMVHVSFTFWSYMTWTANRIGKPYARDIATYISEEDDKDDAPEGGFSGYNSVAYLRWLNDLKDVGHKDVLEVLDKACCAANAKAFAKEAECMTIHEYGTHSDYYAEEAPELSR